MRAQEGTEANAPEFCIQRARALVVLPAQSRGSVCMRESCFSTPRSLTCQLGELSQVTSSLSFSTCETGYSYLSWGMMIRNEEGKCV